MKYWLECLGLATLTALLNYYPLPFPVYNLFFLPLISFSLALMLGIRLPDIDLFTPGLKHRSALTHSVLVPWLMTATNYPSVFGGLAIGMAIHMLADLFPKAWMGGALIKLPFFGSMGRLSPFWLILHCLACLALGLHTLAMLNHWVRYGCLIVSMLITLWYLIKKEKSLPPLLAALMIVGVLAWNHYSLNLPTLNLNTLLIKAKEDNAT